MRTCAVLLGVRGAQRLAPVGLELVPRPWPELGLSLRAPTITDLQPATRLVHRSARDRGGLVPAEAIQVVTGVEEGLNAFTQRCILRSPRAERATDNCDAVSLGGGAQLGAQLLQALLGASGGRVELHEVDALGWFLHRQDLVRQAAIQLDLPAPGPQSAPRGVRTCAHGPRASGRDPASTSGRS